ncbi:MAG: VWA domain-containing protein [Campylobacteraceae bacterium]|nr:VWA domain-containing protein [Campylobacteraceae bacterium]
MTFLYSYVLYISFLPLILLTYYILRQKDSFEKLFNPKILQQLKVKNAGLSPKTKNILFLFTLFLFILSLARPVMNKEEKNLSQEVHAIVVAIDVSKSMLAQDIFPSRLKMAKQKLLNIIKQSSSNAIGVVIFAKSAFILSPITQDFTSLNFIVNNFDSGLNFDAGSNIYAMLEASNKLLKNYQYKNIILLSDGGNQNTFEEEIVYINEKKLNLYTLALATSKPSPIPINGAYLTNTKGEIITVKRNENIKTLSLQNKGAYINYSLDNSDIDAILNDIFTNIKKDSIQSKKFLIYTELFYYPLALGMLFLLLCFSSFPKRTIIFLSFFSLPYDNIYANTFEFSSIQEAKEAYEKQEYKKAQTLYKSLNTSKEALYNQGNAAYKQKLYKDAISLYKEAKSEQKELNYKTLHNLGNSYVKLNKLQEAKKSYEEALKIKENKETKENLEKVLDELKKKKQNDKNKNKNKKENKDKNKEKEDKNNKDKNKKNTKDKKEEKSDKKKQQEKSQKQKSAEQKDSISDLEEKKWLKELENKQVPILLRKVKSKNQENDSLKPY